MRNTHYGFPFVRKATPRLPGTADGLSRPLTRVFLLCLLNSIIQAFQKMTRATVSGKTPKKIKTNALPTAVCRSFCGIIPSRPAEALRMSASRKTAIPIRDSRSPHGKRNFLKSPLTKTYVRCTIAIEQTFYFAAYNPARLQGRSLYDWLDSFLHCERRIDSHRPALSDH